MENINPVEKNSFDLCNGCTKCCEYIALEIDTPETQEDFENIRWYLLHENVKIFIIGSSDEEDEEEVTETESLNTDSLEEEDDDGDEEEEEDQWYIQFSTRCKKLAPNGACMIHGDRPEICRDHSQENCERYGEEDDTKVEFDNADDFVSWVNDNYDFELTEVWEDEDGNEVEEDEDQYSEPQSQNPIETFKNKDNL